MKVKTMIEALSLVDFLSKQFSRLKVGPFLPPEQEAEEWIYLKQLKLTEEN